MSDFRPFLLALTKLTHDGQIRTLRQVIAIGDGANDLAMIDAAGLGIAFCAKPNVQKTVNAPNFPGGSTLNVQRLDLAVRLHHDDLVCRDAASAAFPLVCCIVMDASPLVITNGRVSCRPLSAIRCVDAGCHVP